MTAVKDLSVDELEELIATVVRRTLDEVLEDREGEVILRLPVELPTTSLAELIGCSGYQGPRRSIHGR